MKKSILIVVIVMLAVIAGVSIVGKRETEKNKIVHELTEQFEEKGLRDVEIQITDYDREYHWYYVTVSCSNMDELSINEMYEVGDISCPKAFVELFYSDTDKYEIYSSTRSIYKNGKVIDDDYWHSPSHRSLQKQESNKSRSSSNSQSNGYRDGSLSHIGDSGRSYREKKSSKGFTDSYGDGYDDIYMDDDYDEDRYRNDDDYASGVDDAMEDFDW